jgi:hypothetical protein
MGRIKGSKNKVKEKVELPDGVTEISRSLNHAGGFAIDVSKFHTPFPDNWDKLSKTDKLSWLTSNRKR